MTEQESIDRVFMDAAIGQARLGYSEGGVPIGAVLVLDGVVKGKGRNRRLQLGSAIRHAETDALENAGWLSPSDYAHSCLYTTLSPCFMCSGAVLHYGIGRVVIGDDHTVPGRADLLHSEGVEVVNLFTDEGHKMMASFIKEHPEWRTSSLH